jgi:hypothetical protein
MKATCPALDLEVMEGGHMLPITVPDRAPRGAAGCERQRGAQAAEAPAATRPSLCPRMIRTSSCA